MRADFVGFRAIEIGLCGGDVFLAIAVFFQLVIGFGLCRRGAGFRDFFGTVAAPGFFSVGADCSREACNSRSSKVIKIWPGWTESPSWTRTLSMRPPLFEPTRMLRASTRPAPCSAA